MSRNDNRAVHRLALVAVSVAVSVALSIGSASAQAPVPEKFRTIDAQLSADCAAGTFAGVVSVTERGTRVYSHVCGMSDRAAGTPLTLQSRVKIFSMSKTMTALAVMALVDRGKLTMSDSAGRYIPDLPQPWRVVTIRQLLEHTSGTPDLTQQLLDAYLAHPNDGWTGAMTRTLAGAAATPLLEAPGSKFRYDNFGYELLADVVQRVTGKDFPTAMRELVFAPAEMRSAEIARPHIVDGKIDGSEPSAGLAVGYACKADGGAPTVSYSFVQMGAGAVYANVDDLEQLDRAVRAGRIVSDSMQRASITDAYAATGGSPYGYGVIVRQAHGKPYLQHDGGNNGYVSDLARGVDREVTVAVLSNDSCADVDGVRKVLMSIELGSAAP